jgi:gliding motility-associated-like protein
MKRALTTFWIINALLLSSVSSLSASVVAKFSSNVTSGCSPLSVNFTDLSTGSPTTWSWTFGNGNGSGFQNSATIYTTPGVYTVTLTASNSTSTSTSTEVITVFSNPTASFTTAPTSSCIGNPMVFTDHSIPGSGAINSWSWDFGDGISVVTASGTATHIYGSGGTYPASLIVTDIHGCTGKIVVSVIVNPAPTASFSGSPVFSCTPPLLVTFTNSSTASGSPTYSWDFGDGNTSVSVSPTHNYAASGSYTVKLIVTQGTCKDSVIKTNFVVIKKIIADFKQDTTKICAGATVHFTNLSVPVPSTNAWTFGDGGTSVAASPSYVYATPGTYTVSLNVTDANGCTDTKTKNALITVTPNPQAGFTNTTSVSCSVPFSVTFTDTTTGAISWNWNFGDGGTSTIKNPSHLYLSAGTYTVTLTILNANGCTSTVIKNNLVILALPKVGFSGAKPLRGCVPLTVVFTDTVSAGLIPIATYIWDFGNGTTVTTSTPTAPCTYTTAGIFNVKLTIVTTTGCKDSLTKPGYIRTGAPPVALFSNTPDTICYGKSINFTDLSTGGANAWFWKYGDGATDSLQSPKHVYGDTGTFTVMLIAFNNGCADTLIKPKLITVLPPKPAFSFLLSCINYFTVQFTNTSVKADSITWDFGDGTFDFTNNNTPTHVYATRGSKIVVLTAFNTKTGCSFTASQSFTIAVPLASFSSNPNPANGCIPLTVNFNSTSQDASIYAWNFGDGGSGTIGSPFEIYTTKGTFNVKLIITDVNGCKDSVNMPKYVHALGIDQALFSGTPQVGCAPLLVTFRDSSVSDSTITKWTWNYGDGSPLAIAGSSPSHVYALRGSYTVKMIIQDKDGCTDSLTKLNYIRPTKPYPALLVDTFRCKGDLMLFDASATSVFPPASYSWTFGDGTTSTTATPTTSHSYPSDNTYTVTLAVTDGNGCDSTITRKILILKPKASFRDSVLSYGCGTEHVQFFDQSTGYVTNWLWDFGNGATSTLSNPAYTYTSPGTYKVNLIVTNAGGCKDTVRKDSLIVVPGPIGTFSFSPVTGCVPLSVLFHASSNNASYFVWDFGDGTVLPKSTQSTVTHVYTHAIIATPILLLGDTLPNGAICELPATNLTGNVNATQLIQIRVIPAGPILITEDNFIALSTTLSGPASGNVTYSWTPSTGLSCTSCDNPIVSCLGKDTTYYVTITDIGTGGCVNTDSVRIKFNPCETKTSVPNVFTPNDDGINDILYVSGLCIINNFQLSIYDRWGVQMYSTTQRHNGWDGRNTAGKPAPDGVYYYIIQVDSKTYTGFAQLIR